MLNFDNIAGSIVLNISCLLSEEVKIIIWDKLTVKTATATSNTYLANIDCVVTYGWYEE